VRPPLVMASGVCGAHPHPGHLSRVFPRHCVMVGGGKTVLFRLSSWRPSASTQVFGTLPRARLLAATCTTVCEREE
jgi:hypothetical protein